MSLMYKIEVKENVKICVDVHDEILHQIRLQQILSKEEMIDIFVEELEKKGFSSTDRTDIANKKVANKKDISNKQSQNHEKVWIRHDEELDEIQIFDPQKMELMASINQSREEEKEITREGHGDLDFNTKGQIRRRALHLIEEDRQQLEQDLQEQVQQEITQKLQDNTEKRNADIQDVLQRTYGRALKERAKTIGQVVAQQESENDGIYELKITIEL